MDKPRAALPSNAEENRGPDILAATLLVTTLATITVTARGYVRLFVIRNTGWDDAFMTLAITLAWAGQCLNILGVLHGAGRHIGDVDPVIYGTGLKLDFIRQPIFLIAICVVKLSVGSSLLRIASIKSYKYLILSIMGFMVFYTVAYLFTLFFQCSDIRYYWDTTVKATCWSRQAFQGLYYTNASFNILTDVLFAIFIPIPMLWKLNIHFRTRITLISILGLGVFACAVAIVKLVYITNYGKFGDWLWDSRNLTIWTAVELNVGIITGSLPCLRPISKHFLGSSCGNGLRKAPTIGIANYGHGTLLSGRNWQTLFSGRCDEVAHETSSQRAINAGINEHELRGHMAIQTTISGHGEAKSSDESVDLVSSEIGHRKHHSGIKKITVITVEVSTSSLDKS